MSVSISNYTHYALGYSDPSDTTAAQELMDGVTAHHHHSGTSTRSPVSNHVGLSHMIPKKPRVATTEETSTDTAAQSAAAQAQAAWQAQQAAQGAIRG